MFIDVSTESKVMCPQPDQAINENYGVAGQEDCLVLNVYVPQSVYNDSSVKVPVMTWIHGGGLVSLKLKIYYVVHYQQLLPIIFLLPQKSF